MLYYLHISAKLAPSFFIAETRQLVISRLLVFKSHLAVLLPHQVPVEIPHDDLIFGLRALASSLRAVILTRQLEPHRLVKCFHLAELHVRLRPRALRPRRSLAHIAMAREDTRRDDVNEK
jgi:hypothetical protein